jgi:hypothetical protein
MSVKAVIYNETDYHKHGDKDNTINKSLTTRCNCLNYSKDKDGIYVYDKDTIEFDRCTEEATKDGFCDKHQECYKFMELFTNGYEPEYKPEKWNSSVFVKGSHNCYAYFLDAPNESLAVTCEELCADKYNCPQTENTCKNLIPQPGDASLLLKNGNTNAKNYNYDCNEMINRIKSDNKKITRTNLTSKCPNKYYKGAMVVDRGNTFHFYRLNKDGKWSHKPGITSVKTHDASEMEIVVPHFADRNYSRGRHKSNINYNDFCGYFCIPLETEGTKLMA